jgi:prolipoprotein diacylglyceryltransferase
MTLIAARMPAVWPQRRAFAIWNGQEPGLSIFTGLIALALAAWPIVAAINAPVTNLRLVEEARVTLILAAALYYRSILLSSAPLLGAPHRP